jgi:uncharacterized membrane protein
MKKPLNNEQMLKALLKDLSPMEIAILRERIVCITDITRNSLLTQPKKWENGIVSPRLYEVLCDKVEKHIGFNN